MTHRTRTIASIFIWLLAAPASARDWVEYRSDHFTLYSDVRTDDAIEVLENFEIFRYTALTVLKLPDMPDAELVILAFDRPRDFQPLTHGGRMAGFFYHSIFGPRMIVGPSLGADAMGRTLFHEYVHYLMDRHSTRNYPIWYAEGLATLLSTADVSESPIVVGKPPRGFSNAVRLGRDATVGDVIDISDDGMPSGFYLTSWLLTHYVLLDSTGSPDRRAALLEYLERFDAGDDPVEAFETSLGMTASEADEALVSYGNRRVLPGLALPSVPYSGRLTQRVLTEAEALYRLGDIAVEIDAFEAAHRHFDDFEALGADSRFEANVASRRAVAHIHEHRVDEGDALIDELLARAPEDADVLADIAHYAFDRFRFERERSGDAERIHLARAIRFGELSVASNPRDLEALFYLGHAYEADGQLQRALDTLLASYDVNPTVPALNISLVRILVKGGQPELASYLLSRLYSASHSAEGRAAIRQLRQDIEAGNVDLTALGDL